MARRKEQITPEADEVPEPGALVAQAHGGALRYGSQPGTNAGGSGRPKSEVREALLRGFDERGVAFIASVVDGEVSYTLRGMCPDCGKEGKGDGIEEALKVIPSITDRIRAAEVQAKYALGTQKELTVDVVQGRLADTAKLLREQLPKDLYEKVGPMLRALWNGK